jgi:hypothetical protein
MQTTMLLVCLTIASNAWAVSQNDVQDHNADHCGMMRRGDEAMGFSHDTTTHHFRLFKDGGEIVVEANDPKDSASIAQIRTHLAHIARLFSAGDFDVPMFIHDTTPPGVRTMAQRKDEIRYQYSDTDRGALVRITAGSPSATDAVHAFLLFQMADHRTGDSPKIADEPDKK